MKTNVGAIDRILRLVVGIALIAFALGFIAPGAPSPGSAGSASFRS
jgi:DUF2892 family protein